MKDALENGERICATDTLSPEWKSKKDEWATRFKEELGCTRHQELHFGDDPHFTRNILDR